MGSHGPGDSPLGKIQGNGEGGYNNSPTMIGTGETTWTGRSFGGKAFQNQKVRDVLKAAPVIGIAA